MKCRHCETDIVCVSPGFNPPLWVHESDGLLECLSGATRANPVRCTDIIGHGNLYGDYKYCHVCGGNV